MLRYSLEAFPFPLETHRLLFLLPFYFPLSLALPCYFPLTSPLDFTHPLFTRAQVLDVVLEFRRTQYMYNSILVFRVLVLRGWLITCSDWRQTTSLWAVIMHACMDNSEDHGKMALIAHCPFLTGKGSRVRKYSNKR